MQSVPKKTSIAKSDLLNTTAILPRKKNLKKKECILKKCRIIIYIYYNNFNSSMFDHTMVIPVRLQ